MDRKTAYCVFGVVLALCAVAMAMAPRTEVVFVIFTSLYAFILGFCYAGFGAVTLEAIGLGAAATKYNLLASISNIAITYMTLVLGWAQARWGSGGMLLTEAAFGAGAVALFSVFAAMTRARTPAAGPAVI